MADKSTPEKSPEIQRESRKVLLAALEKEKAAFEKSQKEKPLESDQKGSSPLLTAKRDKETRKERRKSSAPSDAGSSSVPNESKDELLKDKNSRRRERPKSMMGIYKLLFWFNSFLLFEPFLFEITKLMKNYRHDLLL